MAEIRVGDANGSGPIIVTIVSSGGDSETLELTAEGTVNWAGTIPTTPNAGGPNDGILNVAIDEELTVTYEDPDDGFRPAAMALSPFGFS